MILSDINLALTKHARRHLIAEGLKPETIIKTGSHMQEVLDFYMPRIKAADILERLKLEQGKFFVVSIHREENVDTLENLRNLLETLKHLAGNYGYPVMISTHPRTGKRLDALGEPVKHSKKAINPPQAHPPCMAHRQPTRPSAPNIRQSGGGTHRGRHRSRSHPTIRP